MITYDEAVRQASKPDDFALRVSGVSGTSDSKWDGFEKPAEAAAARAPLAPPRAARAGTQAAPKQQTGREPGPDDFTIERF